MMLKSRSLKPSKYRAGEWSKQNMKWTRAEDWAALGRANAEDQQRSIENNLKRIDKQRSIDDGEELNNG